jgi:hypothetical protein
MKCTKKCWDKLLFIYNLGNSYESLEDTRSLFENGYVIIDSRFTNSKGHVRTIISPKGVEKAKELLASSCGSSSIKDKNKNKNDEKKKNSIDVIKTINNKGERMIEYTIRDDIPVPPRKAGTQKYPFALLDVGQSFHVPEDADTTHRALQVKVANQNLKGKELDPAGGTHVNRAGNEVANTVQVKHYVLRKTDDTDPDGPGYRVFRDI